MRKHPLISLALSFVFSLGLGASTAATTRPALAEPSSVALVSSREVSGTVRSFNHFDMSLRTRGRIVRVRLRPGTIIRPTGLTIQPGMRVRVLGYWQAGVFEADRIHLIR